MVCWGWGHRGDTMHQHPQPALTGHWSLPARDLWPSHMHMRRPSPCSCRPLAPGQLSPSACPRPCLQEGSRKGGRGEASVAFVTHQRVCQANGPFGACTPHRHAAHPSRFVAAGAQREGCCWSEVRSLRAVWPGGAGTPDRGSTGTCPRGRYARAMRVMTDGVMGRQPDQVASRGRTYPPVAAPQLCESRPRGDWAASASSSKLRCSSATAARASNL